MTNKDRQNSLDKTKWLESEKQKRDMSGDMPYCNYCEWSQPAHPHWFCLGTHEQRVKACACAKAYNRMVRNEKKVLTRLKRGQQ